MGAFGAFVGNQRRKTTPRGDRQYFFHLRTAFLAAMAHQRTCVWFPGAHRGVERTGRPRRGASRVLRFASGKKHLSWDKAAAAQHMELIRETRGRNAGNSSPVRLMGELKELRWSKVGPFRTADALHEALDRIRKMRERELPAAVVSAQQVHNASLVEWFEMRSGL
jgi:hypothetical protein